MKKIYLIASILLLASCANPSSTSQEISEPLSEESSSIEVASSEQKSEEESIEELSSEEIVSSEDISIEEVSEETEGYEEVEMTTKNAPIMHAWDLSCSQIMSYLDDIEGANFKAIQLSPMQPSKSEYANAPWWNIYQPLGFQVGQHTPIGTKAQLTELCRKANEKGIDIIMDVVTNHLAQGDYAHLYSGVRDYESTIYNQGMIHGITSNTDDNSLMLTVRGTLGGLPDLKTENSHVQSRVISMLKEYLDCGVKGFRFDAAKHIETKYDGDYASNFWDNVIDTINAYGLEKYSQKPFIYGEILYKCGAGRSWNNYTYHMSVTDNVQGSKILNGVLNRNANEAAASEFNVGSGDKAVLWAESHDTFENKEQKTTHVSTNVLDLTYAIQISRKDATALYFARPKGDYEIDKAPQVTSGPMDNYKSSLVSAANLFHNDFLGGSENIRAINGKVVNIRHSINNKNIGALIADPSFSSSTSLTIPGLSDGTYTDLITKRNYEIRNGAVNVQLTKGACILEKYLKGDTSNAPKIQISTPNGATSFEDKMSVTINVKNAETSYYSVNGGSYQAFNGSTTFVVGENGPEGEYKISVTATSPDGISKTSSLSLAKLNLANKALVINDVPSSTVIYAWVWKGTGEGSKWQALNKIGTTSYITNDDMGNRDHFLIVYLREGATEPNWNGAVQRQTVDYEISQGKVYDYNSLNWR